jgi:hypothetical protein
MHVIHHLISKWKLRKINLLVVKFLSLSLRSASRLRKADIDLMNGHLYSLLCASLRDDSYEEVH